MFKVFEKYKFVIPGHGFRMKIYLCSYMVSPDGQNNEKEKVNTMEVNLYGGKRAFIIMVIL